VVKDSRRLAIATMAVTITVGCGGASDPVSDPTPAAVTLLTVQSQVFTPHCALSGCHAGSAAPFGLDLSSVTASAASLGGVPSEEIPTMMRIAPGDAASSYLYWKVSANPNIAGDPMPLSGAPLSSGDLSLIASWIDGGAK
jgi:hypothetical protein